MDSVVKNSDSVSVVSVEHNPDIRKNCSQCVFSRPYYCSHPMYFDDDAGLYVMRFDHLGAERFSACDYFVGKEVSHD